MGKWEIEFRFCDGMTITRIAHGGLSLVMHLVKREYLVELGPNVMGYTIRKL